jgi:hypothetical protein
VAQNTIHVISVSAFSKSIRIISALTEKKLEFIRKISNIEDLKTLAALMEAYRKITEEAKPLDCCSCPYS